MSVKEIGLSWIVVKDIEAAVRYYTEVVGLNLLEFNKEFGWAELQGHSGGAFLGIAQECPKEQVKAGQNAIVTFTVDHVEKVKEEMVQKGAKAEGDILEVPGHVKMQTFIDAYGNRFQICEKVMHHCGSC